MTPSLSLFIERVKCYCCLSQLIKRPSHAQAKRRRNDQNDRVTRESEAMEEDEAEGEVSEGFEDVNITDSP